VLADCHVPWSPRKSSSESFWRLVGSVECCNVIARQCYDESRGSSFQYCLIQAKSMANNLLDVIDEFM